MSLKQKIGRARQGAFWFRFMIGGVGMILIGPLLASENLTHGILLMVGGVLSLGLGWTGYRRAHAQWRREDKPRRRRSVRSAATDDAADALDDLAQ